MQIAADIFAFTIGQHEHAFCVAVGGAAQLDGGGQAGDAAGAVLVCQAAGRISARIVSSVSRSSRPTVL